MAIKIGGVTVIDDNQNLTLTNSNYKQRVRVATTTNLTAVYSNGTAGVGATLTNNGTQAPLSIDDITVSVNDRILVKNQTTTFQNGIYYVVNVGSATTNWSLMRVTDADTSLKLAASIVGAIEGTLNGGKNYVTTFKASDTIGTTALSWFEEALQGTDASFNNLSVNSNLSINGNLTVNGTTTTVNSTTLTVDDKNIELGSVGTPTDTTADGGGITLKGTTDKTIIWDSINSNWTLSEHVNIPTGKTFKVNNVSVLDSNSILPNATSVSIGSTGGTTSINSSTVSLPNATIFNINGISPTIASTSTGTLTLFNTNISSVNAFGAASSITLGNQSNTESSTFTISGTSNTAGSKSILIGTNGQTGSSTSITLGTNSGGTSSITLNGGLTVSATTETISIATGMTTGTITVGGTTQTGSITIGQSSGNQTLAIANGSTVSGSTKTINIGTNGASGSTTNITIGAATGAGTTNITVRGNTTITGLGGVSSPALDIRNSSNSDGFLRIITERNDGNNSNIFTGTIALAKDRTDALLTDQQVFGRVIFGATTTANNKATDRYSASIVGYADGAVTAATVSAGMRFYVGTNNHDPRASAAPLIAGDILALQINKTGTVSMPVSTQYSSSDALITTITSASPNMNLTVSDAFMITLTANTTFTFSNPPASGRAKYISLEITNGGNFAVVWPANTRWPGGTAPTLTTNGIDIVAFYTDDAGANYRAVLAQKDSK